ncbi:MAG: single-stranded DNA-binding protein [Actinomycetota bacterium]|nr:single-stranded DNA-binding protein [Actinomycetota bacterium]
MTATQMSWGLCARRRLTEKCRTGSPLKRKPERFMAGLVEITLAGMLVTDPELSVSPTGAAVARFTVVADDSRYDPVTGQWVNKGATFLRCSIGDQAAKNVAESLTMGARVLVTGVLRQREWETTNGDKRYAYEVDATDVGASLTWATVTVTPAPPTSPAGTNPARVRLARRCRSPMTAAGRGHHPSPPMTRDSHRPSKGHRDATRGPGRRFHS